MPATKALCWAKTWEGQKIGDGRPGPVYNKLMAAWQAHVDCDFVAQVLSLPLKLDQALYRDEGQGRPCRCA